MLSLVDLLLIKEAVDDALTEVEVCEDISQGVEDKLRAAQAVLEEVNPNV